MVADIGIISRLFLMYFCRKVRVVVQFKQWCRNVGSVKEKLRRAYKINVDRSLQSVLGIFPLSTAVISFNSIANLENP